MRRANRQCAWATGFLPFILLMLLGCNGRPDADPMLKRSQVTLLDDGSVVLTTDILKQIKPRVSDYQWDILSDGVLTFAEYEGAYLATKGCAIDLGYVITEEYPPSMSRSGRFGLFHESPASPELERSLQDCRNTFVNELQRFWEEAHRPSAEDAQRTRDFMGACLRSAGAEIPDHPSVDDFTKYLQTATTATVFADCMRRTELQFGFPLQ